MWLLCIIASAIALFFAARFFLLKRAIREAERDLQEIRKDLQQNQILHLSVPDRELERLMRSVNQALEEIRMQRQEYENRERAFQSEIENISHDLRTPLTVILGYLRLMKVQKEQTPEMLETIERKAETMQKLVADFYDLSRLTARDYEVEMKAVDVGRILREALMDSYQMLEHQKLELDASIPEHALQVLGDEAALERIFSNLLQNAGRYAHQFLQVFVIEKEKQVWICFENDVENMKEEDVECLFERFYMKEKARTQGGTGLGLTVAKQLANAMGADLAADLLREAEKEAKESVQKLRFTLVMKKV
ncbi:MAG: HAMP domain-containing sensor histidine kinase [Eubacteriales bacterium]|nr:HAMP domain-containing sensor histidine kinase [Eubacteriales bacterium]